MTFLLPLWASRRLSLFTTICRKPPTAVRHSKKIWKLPLMSEMLTFCRNCPLSEVSIVLKMRFELVQKSLSFTSVGQTFFVYFLNFSRRTSNIYTRHWAILTYMVTKKFCLPNYKALLHGKSEGAKVILDEKRLKKKMLHVISLISIQNSFSAFS